MIHTPRGTTSFDKFTAIARNHYARIDVEFGSKKKRKNFAQCGLFIELVDESPCEEGKEETFSLARSEAVQRSDTLASSRVFLRRVYTTAKGVKVM